MSERLPPQGSVRVSGDGWGVGLYSDDGLCRYWFITEVDPALRPGSEHTTHRNGFPVVTEGTLVWVGLNPSNSDDNGANRTTLRTVLHWAERAGLTRVLGVNLYAARHTDPKKIRTGLRSGELESVIGEGNDQLLQQVAQHAEHVLLAWGSDGALGGRGARVGELFSAGQSVGICANGEPLHPARKSRELRFVPYLRKEGS